MKGVLVVPQIAMYGFGTYHMEGRRFNSLPHGLLSVATELQRAGHEIHVVDLRRISSMKNAIRDILLHHPEFVGCGAMTVDFGVMVSLFKALKAHAAGKGITTVAGGVHVSVAPHDAETVSQIDFILTGEAEWTLTEMVDNNFVGYERVVHGVSPDLEQLLPINRELVAYREGELMHGRQWNNRYPYVTVMVGRGCAYKCAFCWPVSETMFGKKVRQRSIPHLMNELKYLMRRYKPNYIDFIDDLFMVSRKWVDEFVEEYPKVCGETPFCLATRADLICKRRPQLRKLKAIGLDTANVGFESGCQRHLDFLKKGVTVEQNVQAGKILNSLDLSIIANVIFGIPDETPSETMETIKMLRDMDADYPSAAYLTPYPGCELNMEHGKNLVPTDYAQMDRAVGSPKMKGVNYGPIKAIIEAEMPGGRLAKRRSKSVA